MGANSQERSGSPTRSTNYPPTQRLGDAIRPIGSRLASWRPGPAQATIAASLGLGVAAMLLAFSLGAERSPIHAGQASPAAVEPGASTGVLPVVEPAVSPALVAEQVASSDLVAEPIVTPTETEALAATLFLVATVQPVAVAQLDALGASSSRLDPDLRPKLSDRSGIRPSEPPTPTPTPVPTGVPELRPIVKHTVAEGENVSVIADKYGISPGTIVRANGLADPERLSPGQVLIVLPVSGQLHVVVKGDTVLDLAGSYQVTPEDIIAANKLSDANALSLGQQLVIPDGPVGARNAGPADPKPLQNPVAPVRYQVQAGDTVSEIAEKNGITTESVIWANPSLANPEKLQVGQTLVLPPVTGMLHTVAAGDTVIDVAARYDASSADIISVNSLKAPYTLAIGQVIVVPNGQPAAQLAVAAPAAAPAPAPAAKPASQPAPAPKPTTQPAPKPTTQPSPAPAQRVAAAPAQQVAAPSGGNPASIAMRYLGYRYVWAGASPSTGFDCSGLTSYVYRQAGKPIPRDLWGQLNSGPRVSRDSLQVGDLVFFQNTYVAGLSHVGIYAGGGRFIHASSPTTGVITSSLGDAYWSARYLGASRP